MSKEKPKVYFGSVQHGKAARFASLAAKYDKIVDLLLEQTPIEKKDKVAIKMHLGFNDGYHTIPVFFVRRLVEAVKKKGGYPFKEMTPEDFIDNIPVPVFYMQVESDDWTDINQIKSFYKKSPEPKELFLIQGDLERFDGYNYFGENPEKMLEFLSKYMN